MRTGRRQIFSTKFRIQKSEAVGQVDEVVELLVSEYGASEAGQEAWQGAGIPWEERYPGSGDTTAPRAGNGGGEQDLVVMMRLTQSLKPQSLNPTP